MSIRRTLQIGYGTAVLAIVFTGFTAYLTHRQVQAALETLEPATPALTSLLGRAEGIVIGATLLGVLLVIGIGGYALRTITRPLDALTRAVDDLDSEGLHRRIVLDRTDEFGALADALNRMTASIGRRTVSRTYLNNILDSMAEMLFVVDAAGTIRRINHAAAQRLGYTAAELEDAPIDVVLDDGPLFETGIESFQEPSPPEPSERTLRTKQGETLPVLFSRSRVTDEAGASQELVCVAQDITERKRAEEQIKASLREKEVLLREIHHRVKNNLQVISSLLHLQAKQVTHADARALFAESQSRIRSMALIHERLYQSDDLAQVDFAAYLDGLTEHLLRSYDARRAVELRLDVNAGPLGVDRAIPCGLIVNELVANALKHAFPDGRTGTIHVAFAHDEGQARLSVADDGVGLPDGFDPDHADSLGLRLVRGLVQQLKGTLSMDTNAEGVFVTITFPLPDVQPSPSA